MSLLNPMGLGGNTPQITFSLAAAIQRHKLASQTTWPAEIRWIWVGRLFRLHNRMVCFHRKQLNRTTRIIFVHTVTWWRARLHWLSIMGLLPRRRRPCQIVF